MRLGQTCVYCIYDWDGLLVYVGMAQNVRKRIKQHRASQPWAGRIWRCAVHSYSSRVRAAAVELRAIKWLKPECNKMAAVPAEE